MPAKFEEVLPYAGVDENVVTGGTGIVVPLGGSNVVILAQGEKLDVQSDAKPLVEVRELDDSRYQDFVANVQHPMDAIETAQALAMFKTKARRIFGVSAKSLPGVDKAHIQARERKAGKTEALLKILVVQQKIVKLAIRQVQAKDDTGGAVTLSNRSFDAQILLDQMNRVWKPQANVVFELLNSDPALITEGLTAKSESMDIQNGANHAALVKAKIPGAHLTMFLVNTAKDGGTIVDGVTDPKDGISLISDSRSVTTMAHEAGHYLGALNEQGKYSQHYGHQGTDPELLMRDGGAGTKIPFGLVTDFNKGYRAH